MGEVTLKGLNTIICFYVLYQELKGIAFCAMIGIKSLIDNCSCFSCNFSGIVGAVVSYHEYRNKLRRIVLMSYTVDQIPYYRGFVTRGNKHGIFVIVFCLFESAGEKQAN